MKLKDAYNESFKQLSELSVQELEQMEALFKLNEKKVCSHFSKRQLKKMDHNRKLFVAGRLLDKIQSMMYRQQMNLLINVKKDPARKAELIKNVKCDELRKLVAQS